LFQNPRATVRIELTVFTVLKNLCYQDILKVT
jgi:hypothetical protein